MYVHGTHICMHIHYSCAGFSTERACYLDIYLTATFVWHECVHYN